MDGNLPDKKPKGHNLNGRPKGVKNKTTLFKEAMNQGFEALLEKEGKKVFEAVVKKAIEGDMSAAKLIFDRILPTAKAIDLDDLSRGKGISISINVGSLEEAREVQINPIEGEVIEDAAN